MGFRCAPISPRTKKQHSDRTGNRTICTQNMDVQPEMFQQEVVENKLGLYIYVYIYTYIYIYMIIFNFILCVKLRLPRV